MGHHVFDIVQVAFEAPVKVSRQKGLQVLSMREKLTAGELGDGQRICEVQFKEHVTASLEGFLGAVGDEVPDSGVGNVDGSKQVRGWLRRGAVYSPQERVQLALLWKRERKIKCFTLEQLRIN